MIFSSKALFDTLYVISYPGPARLALSPREHKALERFIAIYRPVLSDCDSDKCFVFPVRKEGTVERCCFPILTENVHAIMKKAFRVAGADPKKIGSRQTRKVIISLLRGEKQDPQRNLAIAQAASHSLSTSDRYYDVLTKDKTFVSVADLLRSKVLGALSSSEEEEEEW